MPPASLDGRENGNQSTQGRASQLARERDGDLPVWVRAPKRGHEFYSGCSRPKLYEWAAKGFIRSVSIREPGRVKGVRLFHLASILAFIERCEGASLRQEHVGRHAKVPGQSPNMIERQFAFAAQNHRAQVAAAAQKAREVRRHEPLFAEQMF